VADKFQSPGLDRGEECRALREPQDIARAELMRWRRRLGALTHQQEMEVAALLMSTVAKISTVTGRVMKSLNEVSCT